MKIVTNSDKVKKARKGVMEFLLINHPLDVLSVIKEVNVIFKTNHFTTESHIVDLKKTKEQLKIKTLVHWLKQ